MINIEVIAETNGDLARFFRSNPKYGRPTVAREKYPRQAEMYDKALPRLEGVYSSGEEDVLVLQVSLRVGSGRRGRDYKFLRQPVKLNNAGIVEIPYSLIGSSAYKKLLQRIMDFFQSAVYAKTGIEDVLFWVEQQSFQN